MFSVLILTIKSNPKRWLSDPRRACGPNMNGAYLEYALQDFIDNRGPKILRWLGVLFSNFPFLMFMSLLVYSGIYFSVSKLTLLESHYSSELKTHD